MIASIYLPLALHVSHKHPVGGVNMESSQTSLFIG